MSEKVLIIILKGETKPGDFHIKKLKKTFSDDCFILHVLDCETLDDTQRYHLALKYAKTEYQQHYCIIIKDSSLIYVNNIKNYIDEAITINADLFFLCKYQDCCHQYIGVEHYPHFKWTFACCATQAIMFKPKVRNLIIKQLYQNSIEHILLNNLKNNHLKGIVCLPNIVHFDIHLARTNDDYYKLNECAIIKNEEDNTSDSTNITCMVLIIILILFLVLIVPYYKNYNQLF